MSSAVSLKFLSFLAVLAQRSLACQLDGAVAEVFCDSFRQVTASSRGRPAIVSVGQQTDLFGQPLKLASLGFITPLAESREGIALRRREVVSIVVIVQHNCVTSLTQGIAYSFQHGFVDAGVHCGWVRMLAGASARRPTSAG